MTDDEAFRLIENLDYERGRARASAPTYALLQIDRNGCVLCVERFQQPSTEAEQVALLQKHRGTVQLNGRPGMYASVDDLRIHIQANMDIFSAMKPQTSE